MPTPCPLSRPLASRMQAMCRHDALSEVRTRELSWASGPGLFGRIYAERQWGKYFKSWEIFHCVRMASGWSQLCPQFAGRSWGRGGMRFSLHSRIVSPCDWYIVQDLTWLCGSWVTEAFHAELRRLGSIRISGPPFNEPGPWTHHEGPLGTISSRPKTGVMRGSGEKHTLWPKQAWLSG